MSFNVWSDAPRNARWAVRREDIARLILDAAPDLLGLQEPTWAMLSDLQERLPDYAWVGAGRADGAEAGEFNPIFYRRDRFKLSESGTFWLAREPARPARGWGAACPRIVTWARFADVTQPEVRIAHFNTHFDHFSQRARRESAALLLRQIAAIAGHDAVVVTGDFNCRETSATYAVLTGRAALRDTLHDSAQPPAGPRRTFRGLLGHFGLGRIDYIFVQNGLRTEGYAVLDDPSVASDHRPVLAELVFAAATHR